MKYLYTYIIGGAVLLLMFSCNRVPKNVKQALELAGENKKELQAVIDHYQKPEDSLKLKATYFLIGNMVNKYFYPYSKPQKQLVEFIKDSLQRTKDISKTPEEYDMQYEVFYAAIEPKWKSLKESYEANRVSPVKDIDIMTSEMLIENIDYAFKAWEQAPWSKHYTFDYFCEYILPYRTNYDIPGVWRKKIHEKFSWVLDSIKDNDFIKASNILKDSLLYSWSGILEEYSHMNIVDIEATRILNCRQHSSLKVAALRSLGIPVAEVSGQNGTSWAIIPDKSGTFWNWESNAPPEVGGPFIDDYRYENYTKVFQTSYEIQSFPFKDVNPSDIPPLFFDRTKKDVTKIQSDFMDVKLELSISPPKEMDYAYLCFYSNKSKRWEASQWSKIENNQVIFDQMGLGCIYVPMYYLDRQYYPAGHPIYLNKDKTITHLKMNINNKETVKVYRKARLNYWENYYADIMIGDVFEGSNDENFTNASELFTIDSIGDHFEERASITDEKFRYVRYRLVPSTSKYDKDINHSFHMAEIDFLGENDQQLKGKFIANAKEFQKTINLAFDNDIRTNFIGTDPCWIGLDLGKPTTIKKVKYLFRNSFNTVEVGDEYELLFWNNRWKSIGMQVAEHDYITFDVPKNVIFKLKNLTKGKAELPFFIKNGKQYWSE